MSNTTLDAAKTSRMVQLLQTQANLVDLFQLAEGLLVDEDDRMRVAQTVQKAWLQQINGLCRAYFSIGEVIKRNNWFHSRDFVYLCRFLRRILSQRPPVSSLLLDHWMLLAALRRHFQPVEPSQFPALALHFLEHCGFRDISNLDVSARVVDSLKESLNDSVDEDTDVTAAHCRYTMVIDPTDSEAAIDLLFAMKLLDHNFTKVVTLSDFPDDATPTRQTAVLAQIKHAIETGACLLLKNSAPLQSALYDVINRHYAISVRADPLIEGRVVREAYASIAMGSFSRFVKVHPNFRLVVHLPQSQLSTTPLPFLNRMEKFPFSVRNALAQRVLEIAIHPPACLASVSSAEHRVALFSAIESGVEDFVRFAGDSSAFYGFPPAEAVPALLLRSLADAETDASPHFDPRPSILSIILNDGAALKSDDVSIVSAMDEGEGQEASFMDVDEVQELHSKLPHRAHSQEVMQRMRGLIRRLNYQVLETARVESVFRLRHRLPAAYLTEFIDRQEHFSGVALLSRLVDWLACQRMELLPSALKLVVYTRTDALILRVGNDQNPAFVQSLLIDPLQQQRLNAKLQAFALSSADQTQLEVVEDFVGIAVCVIQLSAFQTSVACEQAIRASMSTKRGPRLVLVVADMKMCSTSQITFCRMVMDNQLSLLAQSCCQDQSTILPMMVLLLHVPVDQLQLRPCYQTIPLNNWSAVYVDAFSHSDIVAADSATPVERSASIDGVVEMKQDDDEVSQRYEKEGSDQALQWMRVAFSLASAPTLATVNAEFCHLSELALNEAVSACMFSQMARNNIGGVAVPFRQFFKSIGLEYSLPAYRDNAKTWVVDMLRKRSFIVQPLLEIFSVVWGQLLESSVQRACDRLGNGNTSLGFVACIRSTHKWLLSDFMRLIVRRDLASGWGLEGLARMSEDVSEEHHQWRDIVSLPTNEEMETIGSDCSTTDLALILLTVHLLRALVLSHVAEKSNLAVSAQPCAIPTVEKVDCQAADHAPSLPLFHVLNRLLKALIPKALSLSRGCKQSLSQFAADHRSLCGQLDSTAGTELPRTLLIIEHHPCVWKMWQQDFIMINLGYASHGGCELEVLVKVAESMPSLQDALLSVQRNQGTAIQHKVCLWMLMEKELKVHLSVTSRLLISYRSFVPEEALQMLVDANEVDNATLSHNLASASISSLWAGFHTLAVDAFLPTWMQRMRDLIAVGELSSKRLISDEQQSVSFQCAVMFIVFKCLGLDNRCIPSQLGLQFPGEADEETGTVLALQEQVVPLHTRNPCKLPFCCCSTLPG